jgi:hypothetical protein
MHLRNWGDKMELYLHGLAKGDFELALRGLLGDGAPLSRSSIERLKASWQLEREEWKSQDLSELEIVYIWRQVSPGFDAHNVLTMQMSLTGPEFENRTRAAQVLNEGLRRVMAISGVELAAIASSVPMEPQGGLPFQIEGRPEGLESRGVAISTRVSAGYFETFKIPCRAGRLRSETRLGRLV